MKRPSKREEPAGSIDRRYGGKTVGQIKAGRPVTSMDLQDATSSGVAFVASGGNDESVAGVRMDFRRVARRRLRKCVDSRRVAICT